MLHSGNKFRALPEYFFLEKKTITLPLEVKWYVPNFQRKKNFKKSYQRKKNSERNKKP
jgi:hypothetical protein